jgi:6,7-dimethyl-8-ribityllumazine synthase
VPHVYEGELTNVRGHRFGIVVSRFNEFINAKLLDGALDCLHRHGADEDGIDVAWVPGGFDIPVVAKRMAASDRYAAIICLGTVIRGATAHFDYVARGAANGIASASLETGVPVLFGVLTTDTIEQAIERAGTKAGNKGWDAALGAIEMADLMQKLDNIE